LGEQSISHHADQPTETDLVVSSDQVLTWCDRPFNCALGAGGVVHDKREGDRGTPVGSFALRRVLYRPDRLAPPKTALPVAPLNPRDGWCDDPADPLYNQQIRQPYEGHYEILWRSDHLYDVIVVLGHNDGPVIPGKGSAIFLHVAAVDYAPTEGCVALREADLLCILKRCDPRARLCVSGR
jgi:L,D-peptidoglycan transpeptidase YkuD (ErfK/YbiS/YcfS/YnhG family)